MRKIWVLPLIIVIVWLIIALLKIWKEPEKGARDYSGYRAYDGNTF